MVTTLSWNVSARMKIEDLESEDESDDHGGGDEVNSDAEDTDGDSSTADLTSQPKGKKTFRYGEKET